VGELDVNPRRAAQVIGDRLDGPPAVLRIAGTERGREPRSRRENRVPEEGSAGRNRASRRPRRSLEKRVNIIRCGTGPGGHAEARPRRSLPRAVRGEGRARGRTDRGMRARREGRARSRCRGLRRGWLPSPARAGGGCVQARGRTPGRPGPCQTGGRRGGGSPLSGGGSRWFRARVRRPASNPEKTAPHRLCRCGVCP